MLAHSSFRRRIFFFAEHIYIWRNSVLCSLNRSDLQYKISSIGDGYNRLQLPCADPPAGVRTTSIASHSAGKAHTARDHTGVRRFRKDSQFIPLSVKVIHGDAAQWHVSTETSLSPCVARRILILGGLELWSIVRNADNESLIGAIWMCINRALWGHVLFGILNTSAVAEKCGWANIDKLGWYGNMRITILMDPFAGFMISAIFERRN